MGDSDGQRRPSRLRFVIKELAILAVGVVVLLIAFWLIVLWVIEQTGLTMCCQ
jgi:hypothetical protein